MPFDPLASFSQPLGDAVVPGGAAASPDLETLKHYLLLREQDVAALSSQLKAAKALNDALIEEMEVERAKAREAEHEARELGVRVELFEKEKAEAVNTLQRELEDLRFQSKMKNDRAKILENQVREAARETEKIRDRVKQDIRKIRVREKELENRLEIQRKDSEVLLATRESRIVELKRRLDTLEFNLDILQDRHSREKQGAAELRDRLNRASQVVKMAGGLLENQIAEGVGVVSETPAGGEREAS